MGLEFEGNEDTDTGFNGINPKLMPPRTRMEIRNLDVALAKHCESINKYEKQRNKLHRRLEELKRKVSDNRFHGGEVVVAKLKFPYEVTSKDKEGNERIEKLTELLMNGQHQCDLVLNLGIPQLVTWKEFTVDNPEQLPVLFAQFDQPGGVRSASQIAQAYSDDFPGWSKQAITMGAGAAGWAIFGHNRSTTDEQIELMSREDNFPAADWAKNLIWEDNGMKQYRHIGRMMVMASMIRSFKINSENAQKFWYAVKTGINLQDKTPQLALRNWLLDISIGNTSGKTSNKSASTQEVFEKCNKCFDDFMEGKSISKIQTRRKKQSKKNKG